jgi:hypothetical protein
MINDRMQNISSSIGSVFMPGQDNRNPTSEVYTSKPELLGLESLPDPPHAPTGH